MKTVKKNVYYCDFCKKRSLSAGHMHEHENHCTANPDRECKICDNRGNSFNIRELVKQFKKRFTLVETVDEFAEGITKVKWTGEPVTISEIEAEVDGCPNCMLAIIRQCKFGYHYFKDSGLGEFDYKKQMSEAMDKYGTYDFYISDY